MSFDRVAQVPSFFGFGTRIFLFMCCSPPTTSPNEIVTGGVDESGAPMTTAVDVDVDVDVNSSTAFVVVAVNEDIDAMPAVDVTSSVVTVDFVTNDDDDLRRRL
jgi:hypothetical protein